MRKTRKMLAAALSNLQQHVDAQTGLSRVKAKAQIKDLTSTVEARDKHISTLEITVANQNTKIEELKAEIVELKKPI
jgi:cell division protein FtsL